MSTSAFGLGIDIPNIRSVIHYTLPFDLNDYDQQISRAEEEGRKGVEVEDESGFLCYSE